MMTMHTFYRTDGTELRVRARVEVPSLPTSDDYADVVASASGYFKLLAARPLTWGNGRFAPVRNITQA